jgi:hypothetical protein
MSPDISIAWTKTAIGERKQQMLQVAIEIIGLAFHFKKAPA